MLCVVAWVAFGALLSAQRGGPPGPPPTPRAAAPIDLTGYWVAVVTEDWRWRMITPLKGDAASIPTSAAARPVIDAWDPSKDEAAGLQCKSYGAAAIMRVPGRLHVTWQDDTTMKIETDAGQQVRQLHFAGEPPRGCAVLAGALGGEMGDVAQQRVPTAFVRGPSRGLAARTLEVATSNLRAGYLRKNGAVQREDFGEGVLDLFNDPDGSTWFMVTTVVEDPMYLAVPFVTTSHFKKQQDASGWHPEPCTAR